MPAVAAVGILGCEDVVHVPPEISAEPPEPARSCEFSRRGGPEGFNIEIRYSGPAPSWLKEAMDCAAAYWESAITADCESGQGIGRESDPRSAFKRPLLRLVGTRNIGRV